MENTITTTLFDYFIDSEQFTLSEAVDAVKAVKDVKIPSVRARIYEGVDKGIFEKVSKGVYTIKREKDGKENTCLLVNGDGRDLSMIPDSSIDCIITDHPYDFSMSLKGGNRDFAKYACFRYEQKDFEEKARVLKEGSFLVEFLPEENAENYKYIYSVKEMAEKSGFDYYASVAWKKGDFVANTGRKAKNTEQIVMFTKGKCRSLRLDVKRTNAMIKEMCVVEFKQETDDFFSNNNDDSYEPLTAYYQLLVSKKDSSSIHKEMSAAYSNWIEEECEGSPLLEDNTKDELLQIPIGDYLLMWLDKKEYDYVNVTGMYQKVYYTTEEEPEFIKETIKILSEAAPEKLIYMSGTNGMLPTAFDVPIVNKNERVHQAQKPVELLKQIIGFVTKEDELILDQFAGSFSLCDAALDTKRNSIGIEIDENYYLNAKKRLEQRKL